MAKKPSTALSYEALVGVKGPARVATEPGDHSWMFVGCVVLENGMDGLAGGYLALDGVEKVDQLLMEASLHATPNDLALKNVEGGEQSGRAVALVVMDHGLGASLFPSVGPAGCGRAADLGLVIDVRHQGVGWRVDIEATM